MVGPAGERAVFHRVCCDWHPLVSMEHPLGETTLELGFFVARPIPTGRAQLADHRVKPVDEMLDVAASRAGHGRPRPRL